MLKLQKMTAVSMAALGTTRSTLRTLIASEWRDSNTTRSRAAWRTINERNFIAFDYTVAESTLIIAKQVMWSWRMREAVSG
jgi:hypothetical protein